MEVNFALSEISSLIPWLVWIVPVVGALLIPLLSRVNSSVRDYAPSIFALVSAFFTSQNRISKRKLAAQVNSGL